MPDHVLRLYRTSQALVATAAALPPGLEELRARGLTLRSFDLGAPPSLLAGAKTTSYDVSFAARREAERAGADDALFVGAGRVLEAATANVWWRRGDDLYTPAVRQGVLPGVTRAFVCSLEPVHEGEFEVAEPALRRRSVLDVVDPRGDAGGRDRRRRDRRRSAWAGGGAVAGRAQATLRVVSGTVRLGGMALGNGVLVHGPSAWACAIRTEDGVKVVARRKRFRAVNVSSPLLRGPARLAEAFALLPQVKHALPEAELPMQRPRVLASLAGSAVVLHVVKRSGLRPAARELVTAVLSRHAGGVRARRRGARGVPRRRARLDRLLRAR